jgi:hypothetical protein
VYQPSGLVMPELLHLVLGKWAKMLAFYNFHIIGDVETSLQDYKNFIYFIDSYRKW